MLSELNPVSLTGYNSFMNSSDVRQKFIEFFKQKDHSEIPSASLVPENDPTTLFISAGMQPLVPYLLGQFHPEGKRLVDIQKCLRTDDIDEVGDETHHTFFEMLGNWSLGDYFKKEAIEWSFEFLTSKDWLNIPKEKLAVSVFAGDQDAPFDQESYNFWLNLGIPSERIAKLPKKNNWWPTGGMIGPCGPDTEMFYWSKDTESPKEFDPDDSNWVEIWNNVFMQYNKNEEGKFELLKQQNVDTGMGLERTLAALEGQDDNYKTEVFLPIIQRIEEQTDQRYADYKKEFRIIADHIKASVFLIKDGVVPANKLQGYILRRLIRRAAMKLHSLKPDSMDVLAKLVDPVLDIYSSTDYFQKGDWDPIRIQVEDEVNKFQKTLKQGLREVEKIEKIDGKIAFDLYQTYGFPLELTEEIFREKGQEINQEQFYSEFEKHKELSQTSAKGLFKGGLQDSSQDTKKHHTATHLMNQALHMVLGDHVMQRGSYVSADKLRFDFTHNQKLTQEEIKKIEEIVNLKIKEDLPMQYVDLPKEEALEVGALHAFGEKYGEICRIYFVGENLQTAWSKEFCGGPHVEHTNELGKFKITKEESAGSGIRRIYASVN